MKVLQPSTMNTSVYDFNEEDSEPCVSKKAKLFHRFLNHERTPYGKQEKCGKSVAGTTCKKKCKNASKRSTKNKSQRTKTVPEAWGNGSSSASDLIEADDSDSESNQEKRKLQLRFGGALGTSCLNICRVEDQVAEQSREVVMHGKELVFQAQLYSSPEFIFTADGIVLKIQVSDAVCAVKWALHEIESFRACFDQEKDLGVIELDLTEHGIRTFLQERGQLDSYCSCHTLSSSLSSIKAEDLKEITSLSDGYRSIWRPAKEGMNEFFQESVKSILRRRQDMEHLLVDCIAYDRNRATSDNWFDLIFPTKEDQDAVTVTQYDFMLLNPDQFLSDTIIDFYIKYLQSLLSEDENKRLYFYNSFFFRKLTEVDKNFQHGLEKSKSSFERVKRWTAKINIFEKDYLFIPIMQSAHWSLVIVCHPGSLSAGCQDACDSKAPMILHFDTLEGCHTCVEEPIRNYLIEAWNEKNVHSENSESVSTLQFVAVKAPQQTNYSDCGLFLLHYVELFLTKVLKKDFINFATDEWFNPAEVSNKRAKIQSLIECLKGKELADKPEESWYYTPSNVTGPADEAWPAQRPISLGDEYLNATNVLPVQKFSVDEMPCAHAFQKGSEAQDRKHYTSNGSLEEHVARSNSDEGDVYRLGGKETINEVDAANKCVEGRFVQSEDVFVKMEGGVAIQGGSLTEHKSLHRVSDNSSPSAVERTGFNRPQDIFSEGGLTPIAAEGSREGIFSDGGLTPIAAEGSREGKRGRGSHIRNAHQSTPATRRVTRSASKR